MTIVPGTTKLWAAGTYYDTSTSKLKTLVLQGDQSLNGQQWGQTTSANVSGSDTCLRGVTALSSTTAWAAGSTDPGCRTDLAHVDSTGEPASIPVILKYNSTASSWDRITSVEVPNPASGAANRLYGISAYSAEYVWAVG